MTGAPRRRYREIRQIALKGADETYYLDKYVFRHLSTAGTYLLSFTRITPNAVTIVSWVLTIAAVVLFTFPSPPLLIAGCIAVFVYHYLDHVDGELARVQAALRGYRAGLAGSYADLLCHSFTVNLWLPALAFGVYRQTGQAWVMLLGLAAIPAMSNVAQYVGSYIFATRLVEQPDLAETAAGQAALRQLAGSRRQAQAVRAGLASRAGLAKLAKEFIGYPGMIYVVIAAVIVDVITGSVWARVGMIAVLAAWHSANTVRRTVAISRAFRELG